MFSLLSFGTAKPLDKFFSFYSSKLEGIIIIIIIIVVVVFLFASFSNQRWL